MDFWVINNYAIGLIFGVNGWECDVWGWVDNAYPSPCCRFDPAGWRRRIFFDKHVGDWLVEEDASFLSMTI